MGVYAVRPAVRLKQHSKLSKQYRPTRITDLMLRIFYLKKNSRNLWTPSIVKVNEIQVDKTKANSKN